MNQAELQQEVQKRSWRHTIDLNGIITPGEIDTPRVLTSRMLEPQMFEGKRVLDIGAWDGFYSFKAEEWGASEVMAIDIDPIINEKGGRDKFELCKNVLKSKAELHELSLYDLKPDTHGKFDVILFMGIIYHLPAPILALEVLARMLQPGGILIAESAVIRSNPDSCFVPTLRGNYLKLFPTPTALREALDFFNFEIVKEKLLQPRTGEYDRVIFHCAFRGSSLRKVSPEQSLG